MTEGFGWAIGIITLIILTMGTPDIMDGLITKANSGMCMEDVKVMCWNQLTQEPRECR